MSEEKTEQLILEVENKTILFDKFRHDYRKAKRPMEGYSSLCWIIPFIRTSKF